MKETKFAAPCFVLRQQLEFGGSVSLCPACLAGSRKGCHCSREASTGLLLCPLPFIASRMAWERFCLLLTAADLADRHLPRDSAGVRFPSWPSARGDWQSGAFWRPGDSPPGATAAGETTTSGHLHRACGVRFHAKAGAVSHTESVTRQRRDEGR